MSGIVYLIAMLFGGLVGMIGGALVVLSLVSIRARRAFVIQVGSILLAYLLTTVMLFTLLFASKNDIVTGGRSAEGGITETAMVGMLGLGTPFWSMLFAAGALRLLFSRPSVKDAASGGVLLATASFNFFVVLYGQKILDTMGIVSGSMRDWGF